MRLRGPLILGLVVVGLAGASLVVWPLIEDRAAKAVEAQLRRETGQDWRVRGGAVLNFRPSPQIVLRDLTSGGDGDPAAFSARIQRVTVSDPVSLAFGRVRSGRMLAEGLSLRAPTMQPQGAAASERMLETVARVDALVGGAKFDLTEAGKVVAASADTLDLAFETAEKPDKTEIKARFELPGYTAALELDLAGAGPGPVRLTLDPRLGLGHRVAIGGTASLKDSALRLDGLSGTIDDAPVSGSAAVAFAAVPQLTLDIALDALTLTDETPSPEARKNADAVVVTLPPDPIPQLAWVAGYEAKAALRVGRLALGHVKLTDSSLTATVKGGRLDLALAGAGAYEGSARGRYVLGPDADKAPLHQLSLSLARVQVKPLLSDLVRVAAIDGTGQLRLDLQAKGSRLDDIRHAVSGSAELSVTDGSLDGLDLAAAITRLPTQGKTGARATGTFATRLDLLSGSFSIADSQAVTNDLKLKTAMLEAKGIGSLDLVARTLDFRLKPQLVATGQAGRRRSPDVPIHVHGPWTGPSVSADFSELANDPAGALQGLQDLGEQLFGGGKGDGDGLGESLGENLGGLLDSLLPKPERGQPGRSRSFRPDHDEP